MPKIMRVLLPAFVLCVICFTSGYWVGNHPQYYQKYLDLNKNEILFFVAESKEATINEDFQKEIQKRSSFKVRFISSDPDAADVLLVDQDFLKARKLSSTDHRNSEENSKWADLFKLVSPDFQRDIYKENKAIPALWMIDKEHLKVMSLIIDTDQGRRCKTLWNFVGFLLNDPTYIHWLNSNHWNTTLLKYDEGGLIESRKASAIRKFNLNNIEI